MINYNVNSMNLFSKTKGFVSLPSEENNSIFEANLQQFIKLTRRGFNPESIFNMSTKEHIIISDIHYSVSPDPQEENYISPYIGLTLNFSCDKYFQTIYDDGSSNFDELLKNVVKVSSKVNSKNIVGQRAVFVSEPKFIYPEDELEFQVSDNIEFQLTILISTSIFKNDNEVTLGYPNNQKLIEKMAYKIIFDIEEIWDEVSINHHEVFLDPYVENEEMADCPF